MFTANDNKSEAFEGRANKEESEDGWIEIVAGERNTSTL